MIYSLDTKTKGSTRFRNRRPGLMKVIFLRDKSSMLTSPDYSLPPSLPTHLMQVMPQGLTDLSLVLVDHLEQISQLLHPVLPGQGLVSTKPSTDLVHNLERKYEVGSDLRL